MKRMLTTAAVIAAALPLSVSGAALRGSRRGAHGDLPRGDPPSDGRS